VRASLQPPDLILVSSSEVYQEPPAGMFPTDETVPLSVPDVTNPRYSYGGGKIASELAVAGVLAGGHPEPGGDRPAAQRLRAGHGLRARHPGVRGPDAGHSATGRTGVVPQNQFQIQGTGQETRSFCHIDDCIDGLLPASAARTATSTTSATPTRSKIGDLAHRIAARMDRNIA
jgi:UDP-glucose 4-epimerase